MDGVGTLNYVVTLYNSVISWTDDICFLLLSIHLYMMSVFVMRTTDGN